MDQYRTSMRPGIAGALATMIPATLISRHVEDEAGINFGLAVFQGANERGITATPKADDFVGFTVRDNGVIGIGTTGDGFRQNDDARVATHGALWVNASVAVSARQPVYATAAKALTNVAGDDNVLLPGWQWDTTTTGANQLAQIRRV